jgi:hypothetical protein
MDSFKVEQASSTLPKKIVKIKLNSGECTKTDNLQPDDKETVENNRALDDPTLLLSSTRSSYFRKHKLNLELLPLSDKKLVKLSDLQMSLSSADAGNQSKVSCEDELEKTKQNLLSSQINEKKPRKKREPSLKLLQKLSTSDIEMIVDCVRQKRARVTIADVKKETYTDKILKIELQSTSNMPLLLSNGKPEALLKKSMFPKELNTLFEAFVASLYSEHSISDNNGPPKPTLMCHVSECGFRSYSEAEMVRHVKRHLAQDGYTCEKCSSQFASMTNLQRHLRIHDAPQPIVERVEKEEKCTLCDYKAATVTHIKRHMAHKHLERSLPCPHCSFMGATNAELKIHMARKHLELTGKNPLFLPKYLRKDYQCSICKSAYNDFKVGLFIYSSKITLNFLILESLKYLIEIIYKLKLN